MPVVGIGVVVVVVVVVVCRRTSTRSKILVVRGTASLSVDLAFAVERRHKAHIPGGRAFAVGLNDLCRAVSEY